MDGISGLDDRPDYFAPGLRYTAPDSNQLDRLIRADYARIRAAVAANLAAERAAEVT